MMSISSTLSSINQISKEIASLEKNMADESKKEADKNKRINDMQISINKNTSLSTAQSKLRQIQGYEKERVTILVKKADINKKIAGKRQKLNDLNQRLQKEQLEEGKKQQREQEKVHKNYESRIDQLTNQLKETISINVSSVNPSDLTVDHAEEQYDVFISHASEDKDSFVRGLAEVLKNEYNLKVWYDEFSIKWGDSLRTVIDKGLKSSKFGVVVISKSFIKKGWTNYELDGLFQKEMTLGKTILPIWHDVTKDEVYDFSPSLAGRKALNTSMFTVKEIAEELKNILD
jgi:hypothetical protein